MDFRLVSGYVMAFTIFQEKKKRRRRRMSHFGLFVEFVMKPISDVFAPAQS